MHERALIRNLLRQVAEMAAKHPGSRVLSVRIRMGTPAGARRDLFSRTYHDLIVDTPLAGAELQIEPAEQIATCEQCGMHFPCEPFPIECHHCGSMRLSIRAPEEMILDSVTYQEAVR
jgi:Zn finger protein HypA/HybF involved in hydrogenase expression